MKTLPFLLSSLLLCGSSIGIVGCTKNGPVNGISQKTSRVALTVRMSLATRLLATVDEVDHYSVDVSVNQGGLSDRRSLAEVGKAAPSATFEDLLTGEAIIQVAAYNVADLKIGEGVAETTVSPQNRAVDVSVHLLPTIAHRETSPEQTGLNPSIAFTSSEPSLFFPMAFSLKTSEEIKDPAGLAAAPDGTLYVASKYGNCVYKIASEHLVKTYSGFSAPTDVAVDGEGQVYVCESGKHRIMKWDGENAPVLLAGSAEGKPGFRDGIGALARFDYPSGIAVDKVGNVFVADSANACVREISPAGEVSTVTGMRNELNVGEEKLSCPWDVAVDDYGNLFIADLDSLMFFRGEDVKCLKRDVNSPYSLVAGKSGVFVVGYEGGVVKHVAPDGSVSFVSDRLLHPNGIALAPDGKALYVSDIESTPANGSSSIRKIVIN